MNNDKSIKQKAEALIRAFEAAYQALPGSVGRVGFRYSPNITDAKPFKVLSQYGDFFFIMPSLIGSMELPILEVLLNEPFNGKLYQSNYDHKLQIRVSEFVEI
jgi:hypothetical protein